MMSVWRRELFKWSRTLQSADTLSSSAELHMEPHVVIGHTDPNDADLHRLHLAAIHGRRKEIVTVLQTGLWVDFPNDTGQTALFVATLRGQYRTAQLLLQNGANPNEKSDTGMTPVHVACMKASMRALGAMLQVGGDLRLHDNKGNSSLDWARLQPDPRKRAKMVEFLQKSQLFALNYSGDFLCGGSQSLERQPSIVQMLRSKVGSQMSLDFSQDAGFRRVHSHGYGRVYYGGDAASGVVSIIPLVTENQLRSDVDGITFDSGPHFVMSSLLWNMTAVTLKKRENTQPKDSTVDLLITEVEHLSKLRHPNLLLLMGICQASSFDNLMLVFERVSIGSLHYILHEKIDHLPMTYIRDIACQVCQAMLYLHSQNQIHCSLSSYAVYMVSMHQAKLGHMEHTLEMRKASVGRPCAVAESPHRDWLFRWMAPEIMKGDPPCAASDLYSFSCLLWEMITSELPWKSKTAAEVLELHNSNEAKLSFPPKGAALFQEVVEQGLRPDPRERPRDFVTLLRWLQGPLDQSPGWKPNSLDRVKSLQRESKERISVRNAGFINFFDVTTQSSSSSKESSSNSSFPTSLSRSLHPDMNTTESSDSTLLTGKAMSTNSRADSDITNNHYATQGGGGGGSCSVSNSHTTMDSNGSCEVDAVDVGNLAVQRNESSKQSVRPSSSKTLPNCASQIRQGHEMLNRNQIFERSISCAGVGRLQRSFHRTASLPWQGSLNLLRAGNKSPRSLSRPLDKNYDQDNEADAPSRSLPLVKPASHSTDVQQFVKEQQALSASSLQTAETLPRQTKKKLSPRRSLPNYRNRSVRGSHHVAPTPQALVGDGEVKGAMGGAGAGVGAGAEVQLSVPGSVRSLRNQFQAHVYHHSLRQSIIKGSKMPHGVLMEDLDTSPVRLELSPNINEIPPEGQDQKPAREGDGEDKPELTASASSKGSSDSLTSVSLSLMGDSTQDEDGGNGYPYPSGNLLDVTEECPMMKKDLDEAKDAKPKRHQHEVKPSATTSKSDISRKSSSYNACVSDGYDVPDGLYDSYDHRSYQPHTFLSSNTFGSDMSAHPFDFQDYYIDDDYTPTCEDGQYAASSCSEQRKSRNRENYWFDAKARRQKYKTGNKRSYIQEADDDDGMTAKWPFPIHKHGQNKRKENQGRAEVEHNVQPEDYKQGRAEDYKRGRAKKRNSYRKEDQWLEEQWQREHETWEHSHRENEDCIGAYGWRNELLDNGHGMTGHGHRMKENCTDAYGWRKGLFDNKQLSVKPKTKAINNDSRDGLVKSSSKIERPESKLDNRLSSERAASLAEQPVREECRMDDCKGGREEWPVDDYKGGTEERWMDDYRGEKEDRRMDDYKKHGTSEGEETCTAEGQGKWLDDIKEELQRVDIKLERWTAENKDLSTQDAKTTHWKRESREELWTNESKELWTSENKEEQWTNDGKTYRTADHKERWAGGNKEILTAESRGELWTSENKEHWSIDDKETWTIESKEDPWTDEAEKLNDRRTGDEKNATRQQRSGSTTEPLIESPFQCGTDFPDGDWNNFTSTAPERANIPERQAEEAGSCFTDSDNALLEQAEVCSSSKRSSASTVLERGQGQSDEWRRTEADGDREEGGGKVTSREETSEQGHCILLNTTCYEEASRQEKGCPEQSSQGETNAGPSEPSGGAKSYTTNTRRKFYLGSSATSQGYSTTLRVESSLQNPGSHRIIQTARDVSTGSTHTVHEETVQAETLRTTMGIQ